MDQEWTWTGSGSGPELDNILIFKLRELLSYSFLLFIISVCDMGEFLSLLESPEA